MKITQSQLKGMIKQVVMEQLARVNEVKQLATKTDWSFDLSYGNARQQLLTIKAIAHKYPGRLFNASGAPDLDERNIELCLDTSPDWDEYMEPVTRRWLQNLDYLAKPYLRSDRHI